ncbi:MAG: 3-deoxy-manno-octulosonate cytidylyltransferase [Alphaproteobacteria bacterium]|nr:MAG: 3-deoxy-manno-octulosonate cytidylyltransferase [Alphaproteobacteria bacterium]
MSATLVVIPARMQASRLPGKPLADIGGLPMVVQVMRRAEEAGVGPVAVATDAAEIAEAVRTAGGRAVMTGTHHESGSDRVFEAVETLDPEGRVATIVNLQGDLPTLDPQVIATCLEPLGDSACDIATLAAPIRDEAERSDPNVVKAVGAPQDAGRIFRALYFTRAQAPYGDGPLYHHIGIYAFRRQALERFVSLPRSPLEMRERLEQLRALEAGMRIDVALVDTVPVGVDTPADLERARALFAGSP